MTQSDAVFRKTMNDPVTYEVLSDLIVHINPTNPNAVGTWTLSYKISDDYSSSRDTDDITIEVLSSPCVSNPIVGWSDQTYEFDLEVG